MTAAKNVPRPRRTRATTAKGGTAPVGADGGARLPHFRLLSPALLAALLVVGGCASTHAIAPKETLPTAATVAKRLDLRPTPAASLPSARWWTRYGDAQLTHWIDLGLADSPDLHMAQARLARARAEIASANAASMPTLSIDGNSIAQRYSSTGIFPPPFGGMIHTVNTLGLDSAWDFDFSGHIADQVDAARWQAQAQAARRDLARAQLAAGIAHAYFTLAREQAARRILLQTEEARRHTLRLVKLRLRAGLDTQVQRHLATVPVPVIREEIAEADERIALARHALAVLAGQAPQAADHLDAHLPGGPALNPPAALPFDLLSRRPDIAAAQARARAALRDVDAARAAFYPDVSLSALVGINSMTTQSFFQYASRIWQVGPAIHLPIFEGGALRANLRASSADADAAIDDYNATVLGAAREVADTLTSIGSVRQQREQQDQATKNALAAYDLARVRFRAGLGDRLAVLNAQEAVLRQRRAALDLRSRAAALDVTLALALGGGY